MSMTVLQDPVSGEGERILDAVVLGLGIHGSAAVYELAQRGVAVLGLDRFEQGHERGSSHGATRMIRRAYPSAVWNELVDRAYAGWREWEAASGLTLLHTTEGLYAHEGAGSMQGGLGGEVADEAVSGHSPSISFPAGYHAFHDPEAGVLEAAAALRFAQDAAVAAGAELSFGETVTGFRYEGELVVVTTDAREIRTRRLVIAGGSWVSRLLPEYAHFFEVWRILTLSAPAGQTLAQAPALTAFSVDRPEGLVFGLPEAGGHGAKVGIDAGPVWDPEIPVVPATAEEEAELAALFESSVPGISLQGAESAACLYTMTPDRRFVLGAVAERPGVYLAAACSGHGFKFGPAIGYAVADLVTGVDRPDLAFLSPDRIALPTQESSP